MKKDIDYNRLPLEIRMFLYRPDGVTELGEIMHATYSSHNFESDAPNDISFTIPYEVEMKHKLVPNPMIKKIKEKFLIKVFSNQGEEFYTITQKRKSAQDTDLLFIQAYSREYELKFKKVLDFELESKNALEALEANLKGTGWKPGYVNPSLLTEWRQFDVSSSNKLDFNNELAETFECVVRYNTLNKTVSLYQPDELSIDKGLHIGFGMYMQSIEDNIDIEKIVTRLRVASNDKASINSANPTGQSYIDNFSFFLYPFERDEKRNVISHSEYMSDDLCHAILDYNQLINDNEKAFSELLVTKKSLNEKLTTLNGELTILNDELTMILDLISARKSTNSDVTDLITQRDAKQRQVNNKKAEVDSVKESIDRATADTKVLNEKLKFENFFTGSLYDEIEYFIQEEEWNDSNQIDDEQYYHAAVNHHATVAMPPIDMTINMINFLEIIEEQHNWDKLRTDDIVTITHEKLDINIQAKLTKISPDYGNGTASVVVSNKKKRESIMDRFSKAIYTIEKTNRILNKELPKHKLASTNFNERNDRISAIPTSPTIKKLSHKLNDNGSVNLTLDWDYPDNTKSGKDEDNIDGFRIYLHVDNKPDKHVFGSTIEPIDSKEVNYSTRSISFTSQAANKYYTIGIQAFRRVDADINKNGEILSDIISTSPYQPELGVVVHGKVYGQVNDTTIIASNVRPDPTTLVGTKALFINTDAGSISVKREDEEDFKETSVGDASSVSGYTINTGVTGNTIPVRNPLGQIPGNITGSAASLGGKSAESFITTDRIGKANGVVPLDANGKIPAGYVTPSTTATVLTGSYYGDGTVNRALSLYVQPKLVKIQSTNPQEPMLYIVSVAGGFRYVFNGTNMYLEGEYNLPSTIYGKLTSTGFTTGSTIERYGNKSDTAYYYEAIL